MINDIIEALKGTVTQATGLRCVDLSDKPPTPCAMVYVDDISSAEGYYRAMKGGVVTIPFVVEAVFATTSERTAAARLNDHISPFGPKSIPLAILQHPTLGQNGPEDTAETGVSWTVHVDSVSDYGYATSYDGSTRYLRAKVHVQAMITRGSN